MSWAFGSTDMNNSHRFEPNKEGNAISCNVTACLALPHAGLLVGLLKTDKRLAMPSGCATTSASHFRVSHGSRRIDPGFAEPLKFLCPQSSSDKLTLNSPPAVGRSLPKMKEARDEPALIWISRQLTLVEWKR